ncbi:hypothetical protein THAOC_03496, partial [Thalassiosira oceanica]
GGYGSGYGGHKDKSGKGGYGGHKDKSGKGGYGGYQYRGLRQTSASN